MLFLDSINTPPQVLIPGVQNPITESCEDNMFQGIGILFSISYFFARL